MARAFVQAGHEIACHGLKWIHYQHVPEAVEREHMAQAMAIIKRLTGARPEGWYTGRDSPNTRRLAADFGGFAYDSDYYGDDLPFWMKVRKTDGSVAPQLIVPYTLDCNDMRFALPQGYSHGCSGAPGASARCSASSTTSRSNRTCGCAAASTSPAIGQSSILHRKFEQNWPLALI